MYIKFALELLFVVWNATKAKNTPRLISEPPEYTQALQNGRSVEDPDLKKRFRGSTSHMHLDFDPDARDLAPTRKNVKYCVERPRLL